MESLKATSRLAGALALAAIFVLATQTVCLAKNSRLVSKEPWAATDHIVQDTIGRGLDFVLRPAYEGVSRVYFFVYKPPVMRHITTIRMEEGAPERQPQAQEPAQEEMQPQEQHQEVQPQEMQPQEQQPMEQPAQPEQ